MPSADAIIAMHGRQKKEQTQAKTDKGGDSGSETVTTFNFSKSGS